MIKFLFGLFIGYLIKDLLPFPDSKTVTNYNDKIKQRGKGNVLNFLRRKNKKV